MSKKDKFKLVQENNEFGVGHGVNAYMKCPKCKGTNFEVRDYSMMWHDGEVWCADCNIYVRSYDAG